MPEMKSKGNVRLGRSDAGNIRNTYRTYERTTPIKEINRNEGNTNETKGKLYRLPLKQSVSFFFGFD